MKRLLLLALVFVPLLFAGCSKEPTSNPSNSSLSGTRWSCAEEDLEMTFVSDTKVMVEYDYDGGGVGEYTKNGLNITFKSFPVITYMILQFKSGVLSTDGKTLTVKATHTAWQDQSEKTETYVFTKR